MRQISQEMYYFSNDMLYVSVSKTTKELLLSWDNGKIHEDPVTVARDLRLPQFEMQKITTNRCHETNHMGKVMMIVWQFKTNLYIFT